MPFRGRTFTFFGLFLAVLIVSAAVWIWRRPGVSAPQPWNVLLITLDTTRADRLGCYGYRNAETPTLDAFCRQAVRYERCYSPTPLTLPSHCTLMTGLVPPRHGIHDNGRDALSPHALTMAEVLKANGYSTSAVIAAFVLDHQFGLDQGFDAYDDDLSQGSGGSHFQFAERNAQLVTDRALALWKESGDDTKFMWVHYFDPHSPYSPPGYDALFAAKSGYDAEISFVDQQLKRLLDSVQQSDRDTLVIITGDHGESLGEHGEQTHGYFVYDATLRVPLLVRFPDGRGAGQVVRTPVSLADILPSVRDWLALDDDPTDSELDGEILPLEDRSADAPGRVIYVQSSTPAKYGWSPLAGMVVGTDKFIMAPRPERYDLATDPHEEQNLFAADDLRSQQLKDDLAGLFAAVSRDSLEALELEITAQDAAKLHSLGYVSGADTSQASVATIDDLIKGPDAKDRLTVFNRFQEAKALIENGNAAAAADIMIPLVTEEPNVDRFRWTLAVIGSEDPEQNSRVADCLANVVARSEQARRDPYTLYNLAVALLQESRPDDALEILQRLLKLTPHDAVVYRQLAEVYTQLGKPQEAEQSGQRAEQLDGAE